MFVVCLINWLSKMFNWIERIFKTESRDVKYNSHEFNFYSDIEVPDVWDVTLFVVANDESTIGRSRVLSSTLPHVTTNSITVTTYLGLVTVSLTDNIKINIRKRKLHPSDYYNNSFTDLQWQEMTKNKKPH